MIANNDFLDTNNTNPYKFQHFGLRTFVVNVNGREIPSESLLIDPGHEKTTVMGYEISFEGSGIYHSTSGLQETHDMYIMITSCSYLT